MITFLLGYTLSAILSIVRSNDISAQQQIFVFDDFREGTKIESTGLKTIVGESKLFCALSCAFNSHCKSFHFCTNKSCKLSSIDANSNDMDLRIDPECLYMGLKTQRDKSMLNRGRCKNGEFEFPSRHGFNCLIDGDPIVNYEFFSIRERIWSRSGTFCNETGKVLLYSLDWTEAGLNNAIKYLGSDNFWVGIKFSNSAWRTINGTKLSNFGMPNTSEGGRCVFSEGSDISSHLKRSGCREQRNFICEV